jgi:predicted nucleic acid-binding protein
MARPVVIVDASPLICLGWVEQLEILPAVFGRLLVPPSVAAEVSHGGFTLPSWIDVRSLDHPLDPRVAAARLGAGESEVLCLGLELEHAVLILDDGKARALARELQLPILGTAAALVEAKRAGQLAQVQPVLDALLSKGFRLDRKVYDRILKAAGEVS